MNSPAIHKAKEKEKAGHAHVRGESTVWERGIDFSRRSRNITISPLPEAPPQRNVESRANRGCCPAVSFSGCPAMCDGITETRENE